MINTKYYSVGGLLILVFIAFLLVQCGGGGGGDSVTPPTQNLKGTYSLTAFKAVYSNGTQLTQDDVNISGTFKIGDGTMTQSIVINNIPIAMTGTYTVTYTNGTSEGYFTIKDASGTHYVSFMISGNMINTYSGVMSLENGLTFEEWDTWKKVDNAVQIAMAQSEENQVATHESIFRWIGNILQKRLDK